MKLEIKNLFKNSPILGRQRKGHHFIVVNITGLRGMVWAPNALEPTRLFQDPLIHSFQIVLPQAERVRQSFHFPHLTSLMYVGLLPLCKNQTDPENKGARRESDLCISVMVSRVILAKERTVQGQGQPFQCYLCRNRGELRRELLLLLMWRRP